MGCDVGYREDQAFLNASIGPESSVIGPAIYWMGRQGTKYSIWEFIPISREQRGENIQAALGRLCPQYLIMDDQVRWFLRDEPTGDPWFDQLRVSKSELNRFLGEYAESTAIHRTQCFGRLKVYRLKPSLCANAVR